MRYFLSILFLIGTGCASGPPDDFRFSQASLAKETYSSTRLPQFADFSVEKRFDGTVGPLDFSVFPQLADQREDIESWIAQGETFAGHYGIAQLGCGTGCQQIVVVNLVDGTVRSTNLTTTLGASYRSESALFVANPPEAIEGTYGSDPPGWIRSEYYVWTGIDFIPLYELHPDM